MSLIKICSTFIEATAKEKKFVVQKNPLFVTSKWTYSKKIPFWQKRDVGVFTYI